MRTTIDLPAALHRQAKAIARDTGRTFSETVSDLVRRGLQREAGEAIVVSERTGLPLVSIGRVITSEDVRVLDDDG